MYSDEYFMKEALKEALKALEADEIPVGAVIVSENRVIGRGHNLTVTLNDPTAHAEMQVFTAATNTIGSRYLTGCTLYVTLEPCVMCAGASFWAQISKIVYGADDPKRGYSLVRDRILHPATVVLGGVLRKECSSILSEFFKKKREGILTPFQG